MAHGEGAHAARGDAGAPAAQGGSEAALGEGDLQGIVTRGVTGEAEVEASAVAKEALDKRMVVQGSHTSAAGLVAQGLAAPGPGVEVADGDGVALVNTSRVSVARRSLVTRPTLPFTPQQLIRLDEALTFASRDTGVAFSVYLGELGGDSRARAEELFSTQGAEAPGAVLIAVSPGERVVEIVTGTEVTRRVTDRAARLAVTAMVASFKEGDLAGGLVSALRMLADQAGYRTR